MKTHLDLDKAHLLLAHTDLTITEVGYRLGYRSNISVSFTQQVGISPTQYRKKHHQLPEINPVNAYEGPSFIFTLPAHTHHDIALYKDLNGKDLINQLTEIELGDANVRHTGNSTSPPLFNPHRVRLTEHRELMTDDNNVVFTVLGKSYRLQAKNRTTEELTITVRRYFNSPPDNPLPRIRVDFVALKLDDVFLYNGRRFKVIDIGKIENVRQITYERNLREPGEQRFLRSRRFLIEDLQHRRSRVVDDKVRRWRGAKETIVFPHQVTLIHEDRLKR